ncbi:MAG: TRAP transporter TatT component family protein [Xanthomonadales bacterium]|nr:TRAP transporter TatT component family protein [Xanthomonadales bacterium]
MIHHLICSLKLIVFCIACVLVSTPAMVLAGPVDDIATGDRAWTQRADGHQGSQAAAEPIETAINAYRRALTAAPNSLEARWKLLRAFHFKGEFVLKVKKDRHELYIEGREIAKTGVLQIERDYGLSKGLFRMKPETVANAVGNQAAVAEFFFWASANWGLWGQYSGKLISALTGVVNKIRQFAEVMVLMDESVEDGGAHRLLGHFNARVPRIPFLTWWVDRDLAISEIRLSLKVAPGSLLSKYYLADALLKFRPEQEEEAISLLRDIIESDPDPKRLVEDTKVIEDTRAQLANLSQ